MKWKKKTIGSSDKSKASRNESKILREGGREREYEGGVAVIGG